LFDQVLPKDVAMSCINRNVGFNWVEPGFRRITGRPQWAIPWMEDDPAMVVPQLWAGRMRRDAADALAYGCTGLIGIHWRTKVLAPNVSALAMAAWNQKDWNTDLGKEIEIEEPTATDVRIGGQVANYQQNEIADTDDDPLYRTCVYNVSEYRIKVPDGTYNVTLKFCEIHYDAPDKRVFGVRLQGQPVIDRLDVFKTVGKNKPFDATFENIKVTDEEIVLQFVKHVEFPFIAGIVVDGMTAANNQIEAQPFTRKINCGGDKWQDYEADLPAAGASSVMPDRTRDLPCEDFYRDWAQAWFGSEVARPVAELFTRLDGDAGAKGVKQGRATLPRPATWIRGPGGVSVNTAPWQQERQRYAFVDEMAALRGRVQGKGNLRRFDYWLNTFRFLRAMGELGCARGQLDGIMKKVAAQKDPVPRKRLAEQEALPVRIRLARVWEQLMTLQLAVTDTPGEMGTVANLEQHTRRGLNFLNAHDKKLEAILGDSLPPEVEPSRDYLGEPRIIVPTKRTVVRENEPVRLKLIILDKAPAADVAVHWRWLGQKDCQQLSATHVARGVYRVQLPPMQASGLEYFVRAKTSGGTELIWPATAPDIGQTMTCMPGS
jgi:hypothetical protein